MGRKETDRKRMEVGNEEQQKCQSLYEVAVVKANASHSSKNRKVENGEEEDRGKESSYSAGRKRHCCLCRGKQMRGVLS